MTSRTDTTTPSWRKSSYSGGGNQCVEVAALPAGHVAVRDSKTPHAGAHVFSRAAWQGFIHAIKESHA
jgi:hypothetical protein